MDTRKIGVEEELFLVDPETRRLSESSHRAVAAYLRRDDVAEGDGPDALEQELFLSQLETNSTAVADLRTLRDDIVRCRSEALAAADQAGAALVAVATPVLGPDGEEQTPTPKARYQRIIEEFGATSRRAAVSGMHVHVDAADDERVPVLDRLRPWLPVLLALSANSPFHTGIDTGHASWRAQVWGRWPTVGPSDLFGDISGYRRATAALMDVGAAIDPGMLYLDARLAERYPTVEVRVADVCTEVDDAVVLAGLSRALVETAVRDWRSGNAPAEWRIDLLRASRWRASRYGLSSELVDPVEGTLVAARDAVATLADHVHAALDDAGDLDIVAAGLERIVSRGSGAARQRAVAEAKGSLEAVVDDLRERTAADISSA